MNKRERTLVFALLGLLIVGGGFGLYYFAYRKPMDQIQTRITQAQADAQKNETDLAAANKEMQSILERSPHLEMWQKLSLPQVKPPKGKGRTPEMAAEHLNKVALAYGQYLNQLLLESGFSPQTMNLTPKPLADARKTAAVGTKAPPYIQVEFVVDGKATLASVDRMMERFHKDPILQKIDLLTLTRPQTGSRTQNEELLDVRMKIEALQVTGAEQRPETEWRPKLENPSEFRVLADPDRHYDDMLLANMFFGYSQKALGTQKEEWAEVLRNVRLTTVTRTLRGRWEATIWDQNKGVLEKDLNVVTLPEFKITDRFNNDVVAGKVVLIEDKVVVFQTTDGKYYKLNTGDFFFPAFNNPLKDSEVKDLGLKPAAKVEAPKEKVDAAKAKAEAVKGAVAVDLDEEPN
ncbi:MAG TPA: hypothetical protein VGP68_22935 [Gemmataceae bacterium]|jgi:hypothetical protein|nr:hypothetical protein [Gemmataceae bacterium]